MDFRLLGPLEVTRDGRVLQLGRAKERALLAVLLLHANQVVSADVLTDRLWGDDPPATASKALQVYVSRLRKALGADALVTRAPGYFVSVAPGQLDLHRFEELVTRAQGAEPAAASAVLREALSLWRGAPLADFAYEAFAQAEIARLEELRLGAIEQRVEADLALGRESELVAEVERLLTEHPLRERLRGQLMLALYRSGRQAEALAVYQDGRRRLDDQLGLEPSESLKQLQRQILAHDPALEPRSVADPVQAAPVQHSILVVARNLDGIDALLGLGGALAAAEPSHELMLIHIAPADALGRATALLHEHRAKLLSAGLAARSAAFSSPTPGDDLIRLESEYDVDLILIDAGRVPLDAELCDVLARASCDVAMFAEMGGPLGPGPVVVPFGAAEHDWAALELGAWVARATGKTLRLMGAASGSEENGRDASRLLADASLIVQRTSGVAAEPLLAAPGRAGVKTLAEGAGLLVVGLTERWRSEGLGQTRTEIALNPPAPTIFVRRGLRPGALAPSNTRTHFTWSLTSASAR